MEKKDAKEPTIKFESKDDALTAIAEFKTLQMNPGWIRLVGFLDAKIEFYRNQLRFGKLENMDALYRLRDKLNLIEQFRNTPEIMQTMIDMTQAIPIELDPYGNPEDEKVDKINE